MGKKVDNKAPLKLDMPFDEAMRRVSKIKPARKPAKRKK
jgi:hypothetical protein